MSTPGSPNPAMSSTPYPHYSTIQNRADTPCLPNHSIINKECSSAGEPDLFYDFEHMQGFGYSESTESKINYSPYEIVILPGVGPVSHCFYQKNKQFFNQLILLHDVSSRLAALDIDAIESQIAWKANYFDECTFSIQAVRQDIAALENRTPIPQLQLFEQAVESDGSASSGSSRRTFVVRRHNETDDSSSSSSRRTFVVRRHDEADNSSEGSFSVYRDWTTTSVWSLPQRQMQDQMDQLQLQDNALSNPEENELDQAVTKYLEDKQRSGENSTRTAHQSAEDFWKNRIDALSSKEALDASESNVLAFYRHIQLKYKDSFTKEAAELASQLDEQRDSLDFVEMLFYERVLDKVPSLL